MPIQGRITFFRELAFLAGIELETVKELEEEFGKNLAANKGNMEK